LQKPGRARNNPKKGRKGEKYFVLLLWQCPEASHRVVVATGCILARSKTVCAPKGF